MSKGSAFILHHTGDSYQNHPKKFVHTFQVMFSHENNVHTKLVFFQLQLVVCQCTLPKGFYCSDIIQFARILL